MKRLPAIWFLLVCSPFCGLGDSTIAYTKGPSFAATSGAALDINGDGITDFTFSSGDAICTTGIPPVCVFPFFVSGGTNELIGGGYATVLPFGRLIGSSRNGDAWTRAAELDTYHTGWEFPARTPDPYWLGGLGGLGIGYLGIRFHAADGLHYGWIRVRLPATFQNQALIEFAPVVMESAYERRTDTPIRAGDTGEDRVQFNVKFLTGGAVLQGGEFSTGSVLIGKDAISYEMYFPGIGASTNTRTGLTIGASQDERKTVADIDYPYINLRHPNLLIVPSDYTLVFGEISLPHGQAIQASRGQYVLRYDGQVIALIVPMQP